MTTKQKKVMPAPIMLGTPYVLYDRGVEHTGCEVQCCEYGLRRSPKHTRTLCEQHYNTVVRGILRHRKYRGRTRAFWDDLKWKPYREGFVSPHEYYRERARERELLAKFERQRKREALE